MEVLVIYLGVTLLIRRP